MSQSEKFALINAMIVSKMQEGMDVVAAVDAILGSGMYLKMAGTVYNALRLKTPE